MIYKQLAIQLDKKFELWTFDYTEAVYSNCLNYIGFIYDSILTEFEFEKIIIGGYSLGFRIAYYVCLRNEKRFSTFINLDGNIFMNDADQKRNEKSILKSLLNYPEDFLHKSKKNDDNKEELFFLKEISNQVIHIIGSESHSKFNIPTFISKKSKTIFLNGGHDDFMESEVNNFEIGLILTNIINEIYFET